MKLKNTLTELKKLKNEHLQIVHKYDSAIKALQNCCEHQFEPDGHDSHNSYEKCVICGLQREAY